MSEVLPIAIGVLALVGFADSVYLTVTHLQATLSQPQMVAACGLAAGACQTVLSSRESSFFGVPTALLGGLYFAAVLAAVEYRLHTGVWPLPTLLPVLFILGLTFSGYMIYSMVSVIGVTCPYCLAAHAANTMVAVGYVVSRVRDALPVAGHV